MTTGAKAFWIAAFIAGLIIVGCAKNLPLAKIQIQETTNNLQPVWPSDSHRGDAETRRFDEVTGTIIGACIEIYRERIVNSFSESSASPRLRGSINQPA